MVTIIFGLMNTGKTTCLIEHYQKHQQGDGFAAIKRLKDDRVMAYDAMRLSDEHWFRLCAHEANSGETFEGREMIGPYVFNQAAIKVIDLTIDHLIDQGTSPIYFDEIGMLELSGKGLDRSLRKVINAGLDMVLSIRTDLVEQVIHHYGLSKIHMIDVSKG
jgi:nucleoside-triphosphatase THEP1